MTTAVPHPPPSDPFHAIPDHCWGDNHDGNGRCTHAPVNALGLCASHLDEYRTSL